MKREQKNWLGGGIRVIIILIAGGKVHLWANLGLPSNRFQEKGGWEPAGVAFQEPSASLYTRPRISVLGLFGFQFKVYFFLATLNIKYFAF